MLIYIISVPVWVAAVVSLLLGAIGTFSHEVRGNAAFKSLALLPISSGLFYIAAKMCGFL